MTIREVRDILNSVPEEFADNSLICLGMQNGAYATFNVIMVYDIKDSDDTKPVDVVLGLDTGKPCF